MRKFQFVFRFVFPSYVVAFCALTAFTFFFPAPARAQAVDTQSTGVYYKDGVSGSSSTTQGTDNALYCNGQDSDFANSNRSFVSAPYPASNQNNNDPWVSSALIEFDQPFPSPNIANYYPNHCLALGFEVACENLPVGQSTYSIAFPLQRITFDIFKYYNGKNPKNPDETPTIRSIDIYPQGYYGSDNFDKYMCASYSCSNAGKDGTTEVAECVGANWICDGTDPDSCCWPKYATQADTCTATCGSKNSSKAKCAKVKDAAENCSTAGRSVNTFTGCCFGEGHSDCIVYGHDGAETHSTLRFFAGWDGSYEIAGEFGKTNGQYGFRATAYTNVPSDGILNDRIEIEETGVYPGNDQSSQIPIQIDVTNVHVVRSTPSLVGSITPVSAQPYTLTYRLSKDADVRIILFDADTSDGTAYVTNDQYAFASSTSSAWNRKVRTLADWEPRTGEGMKGQDKDTLISDFDSWDGRNDQGLLLPAGNYIASIQAKSLDEWATDSRGNGGIDFSRAVTRQVSLDPLKLTDIRLTGLNKQSTAYASISYVATEPATVYWEIYTPGTTFSSMDTQSWSRTGTGPTVVNGTGMKVFSLKEEKVGRMNYTSRWDGLCQALDSNGNPTNCVRTYAVGETMSNGVVATSSNRTETFAYGAPLPDGNYVYVLWAEIPYNGCYRKAFVTGGAPSFSSGGSCADQGYTSRGNYSGLKTLNYYTGNVELKRGLVGISVHPATYATLGSSPTAYGLDPFVFKFALDREAQVFATVENTAGLVVKHLTLEEGEPGVAQQLNTLTWDGRDDQGRLVYPGTYMFRVKAKDAMFPAKSNEAITTFPVDMFRVVDVATTDVYGDSNAKATISYHLSKPMFAQINIYNKDVVIPDYNGLTGDYDEASASIVWPPRVCNRSTDARVFTGSYVDPAKVNQYKQACIYVNDKTFTNYPANATAAVDVRLQPIHTFDRSHLSMGDDTINMVEWDALYFYNPTPDATRHTAAEISACRNQTEKSNCPYEVLPDGQYPFFISARSDEPFNRYYYDYQRDGANSTYKNRSGEPFRNATEVVQENYLYASDKVVGKMNVTRGPVYFLEDMVAVFPNAPQLFNASSTTLTFIPPYEINFAISRAATVEVAIVALEAGMCSPVTAGGVLDPTVNVSETRNNVAGEICKFLSTMTIMDTGHFDANAIRKIYWDGTDHNGNYVKPGIYEVRLTARNYPDAGLYQPTVKSITLNADLFKVYDLLEADNYAISQRGQDMRIAYQISVPMKVAIQILKPGTTIYDYSKGTLRNPQTGQEVKDIREVLVRSIVGLRPGTMLIEEIWDGLDYAGQEVPDGVYPFRFVTSLDSPAIDSVTGEILFGNDNSTSKSDWKINYVADTYEYQNLHKATIAIGDGRFVCEDWQKTVFFYPNPLRNTTTGTMEITKMPVPGTVSIKYFNLNGDLVRDSDYTCVDAFNYQTTMGSSLYFQPDNNVSGTQANLTQIPNVRNAALRCKWNRDNQRGHKVARGVYFGLVDFKAFNGREHCQKVVKILLP